MPLNGAPRRDAHGVTLRCAAVAQVSDIDVRCYGQLGKICSHEFFAFCPNWCRAEFWRSSMTALFSRVLEAPFPSTRMVFPFRAPAYWRHYERMFNCPIEFGADSMEWHFAASVLDHPCPNADPITAQVCQRFCELVMAEQPGEADLVRQIRAACLNSSTRFPSAKEIAAQLGLSLRTLHRRLAQDGLSYQSLLDDMRRTVAIEFLQNTHLLIDQVAERVGFADATSFRKAFRKWTGHSPTHYRRPGSDTIGVINRSAR
jgi:AraC-like DNA-binding protein